MVQGEDDSEPSKCSSETLQNWFSIHFVVDVVLAIPLMLVPERFLELLGWQSIDPVAARLVAAALFGIGITFYLSRRASLDTYTHLLKLKIIWSFAAIREDHGCFG